MTQVVGTGQLDRDRPSGVASPIMHPFSVRRPHGMKTTTTFKNDGDTVKVVGDIHQVDIPSLQWAVRDAFLKRPVWLTVDLTQVTFCDLDGIRWLLETRRRIATCGGELRVAVVPGGSMDRLMKRNGIETCAGAQLPSESLA